MKKVRQIYSKPLTALFLVGVLAGCGHTKSYVSSSASSNKAYVSQQRGEQEYISAWLEAQLETQTEASAQEAYQQHDPGHYQPTGMQPLSSLWGQPAGSVGEGMTLVDEEVRARLNDALATTPIDGRAQWSRGKKHYIFMPNSAIYQPYYSGGTCRDGVFISFEKGGMNEKVRGLFCQQGRGADWYLMR